MSKLYFLVPYFNHPDKISRLCDVLNSFGIDILIVDDGSSDEAKEALKGLKATIIYKQINGGKGSALKEGFAWGLENGFSHAFQIDADMQHDTSEIPSFLKACNEHEKAMICGYGRYDETAPKARLYGRKITDFWMWVNSLGGKFKDSMTGMRIYPIKDMQNIIKQTKSDRMEFDIEILLNAHKGGIKMIWIEVGVKYGCVSHFRAFKDNLLISKMHARAFFSLPKFLLQRVMNAK